MKTLTSLLVQDESADLLGESKSYPYHWGQAEAIRENPEANDDRGRPQQQYWIFTFSPSQVEVIHGVRDLTAYRPSRNSIGGNNNLFFPSEIECDS